VKSSSSRLPASRFRDDGDDNDDDEEEEMGMLMGRDTRAGRE
jgi:hypothetical protein